MKKEEHTPRWKVHPWKSRITGFSTMPQRAARMSGYSNEEQAERRRQQRLAEER